MTSPPALAISAPEADAAVPEGAVTATGWSAGSVVPAAVQVRLQEAAETAWTNVSGLSNWTCALAGIRPGVNTVLARSLHQNGTVLAQASRTFRYVMRRPLVVNVAGEGSVGEFLGGTQRELARTYHIVATPAPGWLFTGWSGSWAGKQNAVDFVMRRNLAMTATFTPNPFAAVRGTYRGLVRATDPTHATSGGLEVLVGRRGSFTGRLLFAGKSYPLLGQFALDGSASLQLSRGSAEPPGVQLRLDLTNGTKTVTGELNDGSQLLSFDIHLATPSAEPSSLTGRYTGGPARRSRERRWCVCTR